MKPFQLLKCLKVSVLFFLFVIFVNLHPDYTYANVWKPDLTLREIIEKANDLTIQDRKLAALRDCLKKYYKSIKFDESIPEVQQRFVFVYRNLVLELSSEIRDLRSRNSYLQLTIELSKDYLFLYTNLDQSLQKKYLTRATGAIFHIGDSLLAMRKYKEAINELELLSVSYSLYFRERVVKSVWEYLLLRYPYFNIENELPLSVIKNTVLSNQDYQNRWSRFVDFLRSYKTVPKHKRVAEERLTRYKGLITTIEGTPL